MTFLLSCQWPVFLFYEHKLLNLHKNHPLYDFYEMSSKEELKIHDERLRSIANSTEDWKIYYETSGFENLLDKDVIIEKKDLSNLFDKKTIS